MYINFVEFTNAIIMVTFKKTLVRVSDISFSFKNFELHNKIVYFHHLRKYALFFQFTAIAKKSHGN